MNRLLNTFLKNYDPQEKELFLTARFVMIVIICVIVTTILTIVYTSYLHGWSSAIVLTELSGFMIMLVAFGLMIKGKYWSAVHTTFITGFVSLWTVMFIDSSRSMIMKMDTIAFIIGLLAAMPIVLSKDRKPVLFYFFLNMAVFLIFNYHLKQTGNLSFEEHLDYFLDNFVVMTFVFLITFNIFIIHKKALRALKTELDDRKNAGIDHPIRKNDVCWRTCRRHGP
jgi:hypothetical protein